MTDYSMKSHNRKVHQRWLNRFCRKINKSIADDPLWLGRFVVEQKSTQMEWFEDKSGGLMYCHLQFRDKKTGITKEWYTDCLEANWQMPMQMNNFIVDDCQVWENEKPYEEVRDYRNVR